MSVDAGTLPKREPPNAEIRRRPKDVADLQFWPDAAPATVGLAIDARILYALYWTSRGIQGDRRRTLDTYRVSTGVYEGSRRLPLPSSAMAVRGDAVYAVTDGGDLHIWRWIPALPLLR